MDNSRIPQQPSDDHQQPLAQRSGTVHAPPEGDSGGDRPSSWQTLLDRIKKQPLSACVAAVIFLVPVAWSWYLAGDNATKTHDLVENLVHESFKDRNLTPFWRNYNDADFYAGRDPKKACHAAKNAIGFFDGLSERDRNRLIERCRFLQQCVRRMRRIRDAYDKSN